MQAALLGGFGLAFLQQAGGALDHLDKANSLATRRIAALPFESDSRLGKIARQRVAKGANLARRPERAGRRGRVELFALAFDDLIFKGDRKSTRLNSSHVEISY